MIDTDLLKKRPAESICEDQTQLLSERLRAAERLQRRAEAIVDRLQEMEDRLKARFGGALFPQQSWGDRARQLLKSFLGIRLGILGHYSPRPLRLPKHYGKATKLENPPRISIVTPSLNHGQFLEQTIQSVLDQDYPCLEYVVKDGGSQDETGDILSRYCSRLTHCERSADQGQTHAINRGFAHTTGEIMGWLNSDDLYLPGTLNYVADWMQRHPEVDVVYGHRVLIDEQGSDIGRWVLPHHDNDVLSWADYVPQETLFWRRSLWDRIGGQLDENFQFAMDWDLLIRFREVGANFRRLPRFLGAFRIHWRQKTFAQSTERGAEEMGLLRERCHGREVSRLEIRKGIFSYLLRHSWFNYLYRLGLVRY